MSGHSKWAQIKRKKGANDTKRGAAFTKLSNAISIAVRNGGGVSDPNQNFHLRLAVDAAKTVNMPKETIERAITRASGKSAETMEEMIYEGFGPGGFAVMVQAATDNKNRTSAEVANVFNKYGGSMGQPGSVSYQFHVQGEVAVKKNGKSIDDIFMDAAESEVEDIEDGEESVYIYTNPTSLSKVRDDLLKKGYTIESVEIIRKPTVLFELSDEEAMQKAMNFVEKFEEMDDVQKVYTNIA